MLVGHKIKMDVEPELKLPAPRPIHRREGRGFIVKLRHIIFLPFIVIALFMILSLVSSAWRMISGQKPYDIAIWMLLFATLFWNVCTGIYIWWLYVLPLYNRWLVANGNAAIGKITGFTTGSGGRGGGPARVHYEFTPHGELPIKTQAIVYSMNALNELREGNTVITVLYSEKKPARNLPYICADYEVETSTEK